MSLASSSIVSSVSRHNNSSSHRSTIRDGVCMENSLDSAGGEWGCGQSGREDLRLHELEEARARAAQMEKTMRWWSDCTANWREKWSKVRTERNKAREELRILRTKLEVAVKENQALKRDKQELLAEVDRTRRELTVYQGALPSISTSHDASSLYQGMPESDDSGLLLVAQHNSHSPEQDIGDHLSDAAMGPSSRPISGSNSSPGASDGNKEPLLLSHRDIGRSNRPCSGSISSPSPSPLSLSPQTRHEGLLQLRIKTESDARHLPSPAAPNICDDGQKSDMSLLDELLQARFEPLLKYHTTISPTQEQSPDHDLLEQRVTALQLRLDEAQKTINSERLEKSEIHRNLEKIQKDLSEMRIKYDDLRESRQEALKELNQLRAEHQDELDTIRLDLEDEAHSRNSMDNRLAELRVQLEKLQAENAAEWGKRERLETEKISLERENKKLRSQIDELEERLERKTKPTAVTTNGDGDLKVVQQELHDKNKKLADLKHAHAKLKKVLQDKTTELSHAVRRAEQYEGEVRKLRTRVDELKKELASAEDEVDSSTNSIRRLQRSNDELQEQADALQVQVDHLQSRLRNTNHTLLCLRGTDSLLNNDPLSEDDNVEF